MVLKSPIGLEHRALIRLTLLPTPEATVPDEVRPIYYVIRSQASSESEYSDQLTRAHLRDVNWERRLVTAFDSYDIPTQILVDWRAPITRLQGVRAQDVVAIDIPVSLCSQGPI